LRFKRSNATRQARAEPAFVRKAAKSECPSARTTTASPSIRALLAAKLHTASAIFGSLSVKFVPYRLQRVVRPPSLRAMIRYPSCLTSCSQPKPVGGLSTRRGRHGKMKPVGGMRRERPGEIRHNMTPYVGGEGRSCDLPCGS
jgi:hypothetical protein